jgi:hypothetical protein
MRKAMIYLEVLQFESLSKIAKRDKRTFASLFREAVDLFLKQSPEKHSADDSLLKIAGIGRSARRNTDSVDHDQILYGNEA